MAEKKLNWELITKRARQNPARIAIGIGLRAADAVHLAESASRHGFAEVLVVSAEKQETSLEQDISDNPPARLVELLVSGEVQGVVRGSLPSGDCIEAIRKGFGIDSIYRAALLQDASAENTFLLAPVGIDEGFNLEEITECGRLASELLKGINIDPRVGVLSYGRDKDRGRHRLIDTSMDDSARICEELNAGGIPCENSQILIESAIKNCNIILAPNGVIGNLVFRSLCLIGGGIGFGAPVLNIPAVFVDTSRESSSYERAIALASVLQ